MIPPGGEPGVGAAHPRRGWLWAAVALSCGLALLVGFLLRAGLNGAGVETFLLAVLVALAAVLLIGEIVAALQVVQAREAARTALSALPVGYRISGRVRIRGGRRPAVADHVVVAPDGRAWAVTVDGSTRSPRPDDPTDGLGPLLSLARHAAATVQQAARACVLPPELGLPRGARVDPCILVARRPLRTGRREGVLAFAGADAAPALEET